MATGAETLPGLLRASQERFADRPALLERGTVTTYGELWRRVQRAANVLRTLGLGHGERVALRLENSLDYVVAYYSVIEAGGVVVALNPALHAADLHWRIEQCDAALLVAAEAPPGLKPRERLRIVSPRELDCGMDGQDAGGAGSPDEPAAILYTSGTTADPRGVTLSHRNLVANTRSILAYLQLTDEDRIVNALPFHYSYGNSVLHTHLAAGGSVVMGESMVYPHAVVQQLADCGATGFAGVPATFALLLQRVRLEQFDLSRLRYVTQAGGAMPPALIRRVREALPHARLFVMYGQTEATARISYLPPERLDDKPATVGIAVPGMTIEIRNEHGGRVATGESGEVCVRGDSVMLGYWNNPVATSKALRDGWLHTGDLGYLDDEGFLTLVGRSSDMIKTGAHRVSPIEVEAAIMELDGVAECAAVGVPDEILGEVIATHVVLREGAVLDARRVYAHCRAHLPAYMIPKAVHFTATLPRTASGKVQRHLLKGIR